MSRAIFCLLAMTAIPALAAFVTSPAFWRWASTWS